MMILLSHLTTISIAILVLDLITKSNSQSPGDVRLVGSFAKNEGRVEIFRNRFWGTICDSHWDIRDGQVVCRQLGYPGASKVYSNSHFGRGTGKIWLTATYCTGDEKNLFSCSHSPWLGKSHSSSPYYWVVTCTHSRDAAVACHNHTAPGLNGGGSCTFEIGSGFCGYTNGQHESSGLGWSRNGVSNYSYYGSFPRRDHTFENGYYVYLRTSYYNYHMSQLVSPQITGGKCVVFYYHMSGSNNAQLNVYVKHGNNKTRIWQQIGGQYSLYTWIMAKVPIEGFTTFQIVFEGGIPDSKSHYGDISLDDIQILNGSCLSHNSHGNCTFDEGNLCGYTNSGENDFDWTLNSVSIHNSYAKSPQHDHTTGKGNYVYIKTLSLTIAGEIAHLISPEIYDTKCVQFYYHMKSTTGKLKVFIDDGVSKKKAWELVGEQSPTWNKGMLPVIGLKAFKIIFEGVAGSDDRNIALDDITVHNTTCRLFPSSVSLVQSNISNITNNLISTTPTYATNVVEIRFLKLRMEKWVPTIFKRSLADQLNVYCRDHLCKMRSTFHASDVIILKNYPQMSHGHLVVRFKVKSPNSHKPFPKQIIYDMAKNEKNIAGYLIVLPDNVSPQASRTRSGLSTKFIIVIVVAVVALAIGAVLIIVFIYRKRKVKTVSTVLYHDIQSLNPDAEEYNSNDPLISFIDE